MKKGFLLCVMALIFVLGGGASFAEAPQIFKEARSLETDETWKGDYIVEKDLNLSGHTLTVEGNLILSEKSIDLNGGKLIVKGDFRIQKIVREAEGLEYGQLAKGDFIFSSGVLKMNKPEDYLLVEGNFYADGDDGYLRAGLLELKGDLISSTGAYDESFAAMGTHKTLFSGEKDQTVYFNRVNYFNVLSVQKPSGTMNFNSPIDVKKLDDSFSMKLGGTGYVIFNMYHNKELDFNGKSMTVDGHVFLSRGKLNLNNGQLHVTKNFHMADVKDWKKKSELAYDQLVAGDITKNSTDAYLIMTKGKDYLEVQGNLYFNAKINQTELRAGIIESKGDVFVSNSVSGNIVASGTHELVFSGSQKQTLHVNYPSYYDSKGKLRVSTHFNTIRMAHKETYIDEKNTTMNASIAKLPRHYGNKLQLFTPTVMDGKKNTVLAFEKNPPFAYNGVFYVEIAASSKITGIKIGYDKTKKNYSLTVNNKKVVVKTYTFGKTVCVKIDDLLKACGRTSAYSVENKTLTVL